MNHHHHHHPNQKEEKLILRKLFRLNIIQNWLENSFGLSKVPTHPVGLFWYKSSLWYYPATSAFSAHHS
jgi:hypothetical protein